MKKIFYSAYYIFAVHCLSIKNILRATNILLCIRPISSSTVVPKIRDFLAARSAGRLNNIQPTVDFMLSGGIKDVAGIKTAKASSDAVGIHAMGSLGGFKGMVEYNNALRRLNVPIITRSGSVVGARTIGNGSSFGSLDTIGGIRRGGNASGNLTVSLADAGMTTFGFNSVIPINRSINVVRAGNIADTSGLDKLLCGRSRLGPLVQLATYF
ncbi:hypothetical protein COBT_000616 [Conglomerata obtusa]